MSTGYPYGYYPPPPPPPLQPPRRHDLRALLGGFLAGALVAALAFGSYAANHLGASHAIAGAGSIAQAPLPALPGNPGGSLFPNGNGGTKGGGTVPATAQQEIGVVTVVSVLKYQNAESAGTGMILTSDGEVLTNNHVIDGATKVVVTVESTNQQYVAKVVGTAPTRDVALLKLQHASGLQTANLAGSSSGLSVGESVVGVGNAGGTGRLTAAHGTVTALQQSITASDQGGSNAERLQDLIQTNAGIISGDSGGPLYDAQGRIVGMDTAANATGGADTAYAIPIENAMSVVRKIESGVETSSIHIGLPGFLGVGLAGQHTTRVESLLAGGPAAGARIQPGDVITSVDGTPVHTDTALHDLLSRKGPGASVVVRWTAPSGQHHAATVTLATGPAD